MAILYKHFIPDRTVFYALIACFWALAAPQAWAAEPLLTVAGVEVDITSENALAARDAAFNQAQKDAFAKLAENLLPPAEMKNFTPPEPQAIAPMIQDYEITREKLSSVRYIGTYTFRFKENAVHEYFAMNNFALSPAPATTAEQGPPSQQAAISGPVLVLPFYREGGALRLWSEPNPWLAAWNRTASSAAGAAVMLPIGDLMDVKDIDDSDTLDFNPQNLARMQGRYQAGTVVFAVATPGGDTSVDIYRTDDGYARHVRQLAVLAQNDQTTDQRMEAAVQETRRFLSGPWTQETVAEAQVPVFDSGRIPVHVRFDSFQQWATIQRSLQRAAGVRDVVLRSLSPREADIELVFQGDEGRLQMALEQANLILEAPRLTPVSAGGAIQASAGAYTLYLKQRDPAYYNRF